jgi:hypothetical protein
MKQRGSALNGGASFSIFLLLTMELLFKNESRLAWDKAAFFGRKE